MTHPLPADVALATLLAAVTLAAVAATTRPDPTPARDRACLETLHGHPTPLGCRLPDGTTIRPADIQTPGNTP